MVAGTTPGAEMIVEDDQLKLMLANFIQMRDFFEKEGRLEPYYSVLTDERYRPSRITRTDIDDFYKSGEENARSAIALLEKNGMNLRGGRMLDFGCGVGRVTIHFAGYFGSVVGCDISEPHLSIAKDRAGMAGIPTVEFIRVDFDLLEHLQEGSFDFIYSFIVLQHIVPPMMKLYIAQFCRLLKSGGAAIFQLPTHHPNYRFDGETMEYFTSKPAYYVHVLPFRELFKVIRNEGCYIVDLSRQDVAGKGYESHEFLIAKR